MFTTQNILVENENKTNNIWIYVMGMLFINLECFVARSLSLSPFLLVAESTENNS